MKAKTVLLFLISGFSYLVFFYPILDSETVFFSGNDSIRKHYPLRDYLYEQVKSSNFPFWTERIFSGFPVYASLENGFLNPINIVLLLTFGPINSYKILFFGTYLIGSISLYLFLKRHGGNMLGFTVANVVYFFGFFSIYHLEHVTIIMAAYLLPSTLYFLDRYINDGKTSNIFCLSGIYLFLFYFGSFQMILIMTLSNFLYGFIHLYRASEWKHRITKLTYVSILFVLPLALPGLFPNIELTKNSDRVALTSFTEGSFTPATLLNLVVPFLFKMEKNYSVPRVFEETPIQETYVYIGISSFAVLLYYLLFTKRSKLNTYVLSLFLLSLFLSVVGNIPFVKDIAPIPFTIFRYWGRASILASMSAAMAISSYLSEPKLEARVFKKESVVLFAGAIALLLIQLFSFSFQQNKDIKYVLQSTITDWSVGYRSLWALLLVITASLLLFHFLVPKTRKYLMFAIATIVLADMVYFGTQSTKYDTFIDKKQLPKYSTCLKKLSQQRYKDYRILDLSGCINDTTALYVDSWTLFGTSQFVTNEYINLVQQAGLIRMRGPQISESFDLHNETTHGRLRTLGIRYVILENKDETDLGENIFNTSAETSIREEGKIATKIILDNPQKIDTSIRYYPGWELKVNGVPQRYSKGDNGVYISFDLGSGMNDVELKYRPRSLEIGSVACIVWLVVSCITHIWTRKRLKLL